MIVDVLFLTYFALPGALANMAPVFAAKGKWTPFLDKPLDMGTSFNGQRLLGNNKTFRGFVWGFVFALGASLIQLWLYEEFQGVRDFSLINYSGINVLGLSLLMTLGALGGDALKSFFKRQLNKKPGESWIPFDQTDSVAGLTLVSTLYLDLPLETWIAGFIFGSLLHPFSTTVAWLLKLKESPL